MKLIDALLGRALTHALGAPANVLMAHIATGPANYSIVISLENNVPTARTAAGVLVSSNADAGIVINAAIAAIPSGGVIYFREGTFPIATQVVVATDNITFIGTGLFATTLQWSGAGYGISMAPTGAATRVQDFRMEGLLFQSSSSAAGRSGLYIIGGQRTIVQNCLFRKFDVCLAVDSSDATKPTRGGIYFDTLMFEDFIGSGIIGIGTAVNPEMHFHKIRIAGNLSQNGDGMNFPNGILWLEDIDINNFALGGATGRGLVLTGQFRSFLNDVWVEISNSNIVGGDRCVIKGCHFTNMNQDGLTLQTATNFQVLGNAFVNNSKSSADGYDGLALIDSSRCTIVGNSAYDSNGGGGFQRYGISSSGTSDSNVIAENALQFNFTGALSLVGTANIVHANLGELSTDESTWPNVPTSKLTVVNSGSGGNPVITSSSNGGANADIAGTLRASSFNGNQLGDRTKQFSSIVANAIKGYAASTDADGTPAFSLDATGLKLAANNTAADVVLARTGVSNAELQNGAGVASAQLRLGVVVLKNSSTGDDPTISASSSGQSASVAGNWRPSADASWTSGDPTHRWTDVVGNQHTVYAASGDANPTARLISTALKLGLNSGDNLSWTLTVTAASTATLGDGNNIAVGTTTGTKIGTATSQKLGFFNATPIVQPVATTDMLVALQNLGLIATGTTPLSVPGAVVHQGTTALQGAVTLSDAINIAVGTTTGTQIATTTSQKLGWWGATPVVRDATAYTQTYATASHTHAARTAAALTDNSGGTSGGTTIAAITNPDLSAWNGVVAPTAAQATAIGSAFTATKNAIATLAAMSNNHTTDQQNTAQVLNALIDTLQSYGMVG